jgi:phosphatidate phosphatase PAH1
MLTLRLCVLIQLLKNFFHVDLIAVRIVLANISTNIFIRKVRQILEYEFTDSMQDDSKGEIEGNITANPQMGTSLSASVLVSTPDTFEDITPNTPTTDTNFISFPEGPNDKNRIRTYSSTDSELEVSTDGVLKKDKPEKYRKTLRLTSEQIANLNLKPGPNEVMFSVTTAYQGTTRCKCTLFLWRYDDKIVISDIDGTITKSDVLGHIMPIVGNAWAQSGVAKLFNRIEDNGYKLLYLSARAIGQSKGTRKYLNSIRQEDFKLPDGPLLLNPTSLLSAFHREVIERKPEEFKISCLRDIQALFPSGSNPFYAGYGNKINDVWTYQAVGIPIFRIFTINHRGELRHEFSNTFQSSYVSMSQIADQLFPVRSKQTLVEEFSEFNYWRDPIPEIDDLVSADVTQLQRRA